MLLLWLEFLAAAAVIGVTGTKLSKYGDIIAEKTGLGRTLTGLVLMSTATSLPELINGISSVTLAHSPDIAVGDIMGSCIFNLFVIAIMDAMSARTVFSITGGSHMISASYGIILIGAASVSILSGGFFPAIGRIGLYTPFIAAIYLLGVRSVYVNERKTAPSAAPNDGGAAINTGADIGLREALTRYVFNAVFMVGAATFLPVIGSMLAEKTVLGEGFFGTLFVGVTTSLPELAVSISAMRIGAADMALSNLLGSNMFNILLLAVDDLFYVEGPLLNDVSSSHALTGVMAVIMTATVAAGLIRKTDRKAFLRVGWESAALAAAYAATLALLYFLKD